MKTPEGRAREVVEAIYGEAVPGCDVVRWVADAIRGAQKDALEDACRRAKGEPPAGGEGAVRTLQALLRGAGRAVDSLVAAELDTAVSYVRHLEARLILLSAEEEGQAYAKGHDEGRRAGWREARRVVGEAARVGLERHLAEYDYHVRNLLADIGKALDAAGGAPR